MDNFVDINREDKQESEVREREKRRNVEVKGNDNLSDLISIKTKTEFQCVSCGSTNEDSKTRPVLETTIGLALLKLVKRAVGVTL